MNQQDRYDAFCELLTRYQGQLRGYILALVRNREDADDLFQATSLVLWRRFDTFEPESNFFAWARRTAEFTVRNFWRTNQTRSIPRSEIFLDALATSEPAIGSDSFDSYVEKLRDCMEKLCSEDRNLLKLSYMNEMGVQQIADSIARSRQSVGRSLMRIRQSLLRCIQSHLNQEEHP
jgi:RNA polymerase sigma-70 factor (ECF subfamily)